MRCTKFFDFLKLRKSHMALSSASQLPWMSFANSMAWSCMKWMSYM